DRRDRVACTRVTDDLPITRCCAAGRVPTLALVVPDELAARDPVGGVGGIRLERRDEARIRVARAGRVREGEARRADLAVRGIPGSRRLAAVRRQRRLEVDV